MDNKTPVKTNIVDIIRNLVNCSFKNIHASNTIKITDYLSKNNFTRDDLIISLGGGVVGDLSGFASSIFKRGIKFIQIPTSLLANLRFSS